MRREREALHLSIQRERESGRRQRCCASGKRRWLAEETGVPLAQMAGLGDSPNDLAFLRLVGFSGAPANAAPEVQAEVDYVSAFEHGRGLVDIIRRLWEC